MALFLPRDDNLKKIRQYILDTANLAPLILLTFHKWRYQSPAASFDVDFGLV